MLSVKIGHYHPSLEDSFVNTIHTLKNDDPLAPIAVVAPTHWMLQRLQERLMLEQVAFPDLSPAGACFMNISFMDFSVLAGEICRRAGLGTGHIVRQQVVYEHIIAGLLQHHTLDEPLFKNIQSLPSLARALYQAVQDLTDADIQTDSLREAIGEGFIEGAEIQKLNGVINVYELFKQKLKGLPISHDADVYERAAACAHDSKFLKGFKYLLAYGFYDLTGVEQDFFGEVFRACSTILFMPYQKKHPAFAYGKPFYESFVLGLAQDVEELPPVPGFSCLMNSQCEDSAHGYESHEETRNPQSAIQHQDTAHYLANVRIINASGKRDEVWTVAKEALQLVEAGYKMDEIGVVARSLAPYLDTINKVFQENYIPFTTSALEGLGKFPLIKTIRQILCLKRENYYRPMVIELLGSPYFRLPLPGHEGVSPRPDLWDILSRRLGVRGDIECWLSRLGQAKAISGEHIRDTESRFGKEGNVGFGDNSDEDTGGRTHIPIDQIELLENIICKLSDDLSALPEKASWSAMSGSIAQFLQRYIHVPSDGMNADDQKRDLEIHSKVQELLHTLCALDCLNEEVTQDQFVDALLDACSREGLSVGTENGRGIKVLDAMSARGVPFRALFVLGLNEKVFPRAISEEPFMRDHIRRRLTEVLGNIIPEKLRGFEEERLLFYFLLNAARERLYLIYERSDEAGKPKAQSHYLMDVIQNMKSTSPTEGHDADAPAYTIYVPRGIKDKLFGKEVALLTPKEIGVRMAIARINSASFLETLGINPDLFARSQTALNFIESYEKPLTAYDGIVGDIAHLWEKRVCRGLSPTALEAFGTCPFKFFMGKVMELEPLEEPEKVDVIAAVDLGSLYHSILKDFYGVLIEKGYFYKKAEEIRPVDLLRDIAHKYFTDIERQTPIPYPLLWENKKEEILGFLTKFVTGDIERIEQTGYIPAYLEQKAHLGAQDELVNLISVSSKQDKAVSPTFKGKIDRIDVKSTGDTVSYRVVDYKSGKPVRDKLMKCAVRGQKLQLPFYIVMAERLLTEEIRRGRIPQGNAGLENAAFVYIAQDAEDKKGQTVTPEKIIEGDEWRDLQEQCWSTVKEFLSYIRDGIFPVSPIDDAQKCEWCEFATICRRGHQPLKTRLEQDARLKAYREIAGLNVSRKTNKS